MVYYEELGKPLGDYGGETVHGDQATFCGSSLWQYDGAVEPGLLDPLPLRQLPSDHFVPWNDLFQEFSFDAESGHGGDVSGEKEAYLNVDGGENGQKEEEREGGGERREEREMTLEEVSRYFYVPISVAAKELNMGLTQLKKKCRELGIPRWPHRKMKSLQALISNVQELGREDGETGEMQLQRAREILERERQAMERTPGMQLEEKTKRLRQACFKANFKKRRMQSGKAPARASSSSTGGLSPSPSGTCASPGDGWA